MPQPTNPGLSLQLARHVTQTRFAQLPPATVAATRRALLDAVGVISAASGMAAEAQPFLALARAPGGRPESTLLGTGERVPAALAAFANGALSHALDYEDAFDRAPVHPNASLIPAVLALAQARAPVSGEELLTAIATGCDLVCRLGLSLRRDLEQGGWYPPPILGAMGAVAACARLLRLDAQQLLDAWSLMLMQISCPMEIRHGEESVLRAVREAFPAQAAVTVTLLAESGVRGFPAVFEGDAGFFRLFAGGRYEASELLSDLGARWMIDELSFKLWPSCRGTHAAIEAALALREEGRFRNDEVVDVLIEGGPVQQMLAEPLPRKQQPATAIDAKFSLPFTVATALHRGAVTLDSFSSSALGDAQVLALAARCRFLCREDWPRSRATSGHLRVTLRDGRTLRREVDEPLGSPSRPLAEEALVAKFVDCLSRASRPVTEAQARAMAARILTLDSLSDATAVL